MSQDFVFSSESITAGHPDKLCDQVSDAIVDHFLAQDPHSGIVAECAVSSGILFIAAQYASRAKPDIVDIARSVIGDLGYPREVFDADTCAVMTSFADRTAGDYRPLDLSHRNDAAIDQIVARDQVTLFGYACDQTKALMPLPIWLAHRLAEALAAPKLRNKLPYLLPDGKSQVGVEYSDGRPSRLHSLTLTASQTETSAVDAEQLRCDLTEQVIEPILKKEKCPADEKTRLFVNPGGPLVGGGPSAHSGLTGRKTGVDTYGEFSRHSGAALSGKGPMRIDRTAAYAARYAAKNVVAAGLARECEVVLSYAVGSPGPVSLRARTFATSEVGDAEVERRLREAFDFRLGAIIRDMRLQTLSAAHGGFYRKLAVYGHMGRTDLKAPWEKTDKADQLT